jgi:hypothetical protein
MADRLRNIGETLVRVADSWVIQEESRDPRKLDIRRRDNTRAFLINRVGSAGIE